MDMGKQDRAHGDSSTDRHKMMTFVHLYNSIKTTRIIEFTKIP